METPLPRRWPPCVEVIDDRVAASFRAMSTVQRMALANEMFLQGREMVTCAIRSLHPEWSDEQVKQEWRRGLDPRARETFS